MKHSNIETRWNKKGKLTLGTQIKRTLCGRCNGNRKELDGSDCKSCHGTGLYIDYHYLHVTKINGKQVCFDGDTEK
ncbi:hypothetical protein LCGC14_2725640 [marine sediment metagenome]|uniref:Uncharacterized protein n=1 Tax=marine sediment metagenome TaxID=412755 RepID=A0A0F8ZWA1_9ZZZZ